MVDNIKQITVRHEIATSKLKLYDNLNLEMPMIPGSYELRTDLKIVISVNQPQDEVTS